MRSKLEERVARRLFYLDPILSSALRSQVQAVLTRLDARIADTFDADTVQAVLTTQRNVAEASKPAAQRAFEPRSAALLQAAVNTGRVEVISAKQLLSMLAVSRVLLEPGKHHPQVPEEAREAQRRDHSARVVITDASGLYKPIEHTVSGPCPQPPFAGKERPPTPPSRASLNQPVTRRTRVTGGPKAGRCEICAVPFSDVRVHRQTPRHRDYAQSRAAHAEADDLIAEMEADAREARSRPACGMSHVLSMLTGLEQSVRTATARLEQRIDAATAALGARIDRLEDLVQTQRQAVPSVASAAAAAGKRARYSELTTTTSDDDDDFSAMDDDDTKIKDIDGAADILEPAAKRARLQPAKPVDPLSAPTRFHTPPRRVTRGSVKQNIAGKS